MSSISNNVKNIAVVNSEAILKEKIYSYEEALQSSVEYFNGDELAAKVFVDKYALRTEKQQMVEKSPDQMHRRIAK